MIPTTPFPIPTAPRDHDGWVELLLRQHGVVSRRQLLRHGFTPAAIRANVRARRWAHVHDGVYSIFTGALGEEARRAAAVLAKWPAALSHETAGEVWNFCRPDPQRPIHVTVSYAASGASRPGLVVHRSRAFAYTVVEGLDQPVVAASHTAVDLAVARPTARQAMATMLHCLTVTSLRPESVRASIDLRRPRRYRDALLAALGYATDGVRSKLEAIYALEVEEAHGLPRGERQVPVDVDGTTRYEDIAYRLEDDVVIVRLDGHRHHADRVTALVDRRRDLAAEMAGRGRIVLGFEETAADPCARAREVAAVLRRRGWEGALRACERCWSP
ncbi:type IV toxin-antitoxin system AbiEi family antitoxin domain-containing protein [Actinomycetospora sp. TBRC 11914]|uniref:type IV toxin-antitoxin system AbiEi family antitoxin domain-containing protein n=1 Tax=Actinomycetospora sp. TBRC 11914 TaxID=2729387 RepID=UPI00145C4785|nr:type IV toxin-antitoxin system AbiEi family antitoxin domain-containing protein [Actinomycetospora sp. TBRC 11914]NMO92442.1 type IV toxin-antitoxin system AbiEi family antitoxin domain-containing protein [Actinomycetospora sp. TBRC 11914]